MKITIKMSVRFFFLLTIAFASCQNTNNKSSKNSLKTQNSYLEGHTFFKITETDSGKIIYKPCDANIPKYKIYKDSIFHNWGQEYYTFHVTKKDVLKNGIIFSGNYFYGTEKDKDETIKIEYIDDKKLYLKINDEIFIDSINAGKINLVFQSLKDCNENLEIGNTLKDEKHTNFVANEPHSTWKTDCNLENDNLSLLYTTDMNNKVANINFNINRWASIDLIVNYKKNVAELYYESITVKSRLYNDDLDWDKISKKDKIADIRIKSNEQIEFFWYGFYNTKTKKIMHKTNPFTQKEETEPVILQKCHQ